VPRWAPWLVAHRGGGGASGAHRAVAPGTGGAP
jgi:hypothetical protein